MSVVCLDLHILIWGIRSISATGQKEMINRAQSLLTELDDSNAHILVPAVVVTEFLAGVPKETHTKLLEVLNRRFQLPPFDVRTAAIAADLWRIGAEKDPSLRDVIRETFPAVTNAKIKADTMILATALMRKADILYTHDGPLRTIAKQWIEVRELPLMRPMQMELFF